MKRTQKWLAVLLSIALALSLLPTAALAEEEDPTPDVFPGSSFSGTPSGATDWYYLEKDVERNLTVGGTLVLYLNGHTLTGTITVDGGKLDLRGIYPDSSAGNENEGKVTGAVTVNSGEFVLNNGGLGGGVTVNGGSFEMNGGIINGYTAGDSNGVRSGVTVDGGTFTMNGGTIDGSNRDNDSVSGVIVNSTGKFVMNNGEIIKGFIAEQIGSEAENQAYKYGGGVTVNGGTFNMTGGSVNSNTGENAGVNVLNGGKFYMYGGNIDQSKGFGLTVGYNNSQAVISGNQAFITHSTGFGAHVIDTGSLTLENGEIAFNDTGVYVASNSTFTMTGGKIHNNSSQGAGGGVNVEGMEDSDTRNPARFIMSCGEIVGNSATPADDLPFAGGGVYVGNRAIFQVSGSPQVAGNISASDLSYFDNVRGVVTVTGDLTNAAIALNCGYRLVKGADEPVVVVGGGKYGTLGYFSSDDDNCMIAISDDGKDLVMRIKEEGELDPGADITRAQLAWLIQQHAPFGLSEKNSSSANSVFSDVGHLSSGYRNAIGVLYDEEIMSGMGGRSFNGDAGVSRAQAAVVIWRAAGSRSNTEPANVPYQDIPDGSTQWYIAAINCLYAMGVLDKTDMDGGGNFNPDKNVTVATVEKWLAAYTVSLASGDIDSKTESGAATRAGFVTQYYNYFKDLLDDGSWEKSAQPPFPDTDGCTDEEKEAIGFWKYLIVVQGTEDGYFNPYSPASNLEVAVFLYRVYAIVEKAAAEAAALSAMPAAEDGPWYQTYLDSLEENGVLSGNNVAYIASNPNAPVLTVNLQSWGANTGLVTAAPTFSPADGTTFSSSLSVTIKTDTEDAKIYYTTNGSDPTQNSTLYAGPFTITSSTTVKAIAVSAAGVASDVATARYIYRSSGSTGGNNGGSTGGSTGSTTTTNPDGSKTTTTTNRTTGTVTETTTWPDGSSSIVETQTNGTVTTTKKAANGVQVTTVRAPGASVTASVIIPEGVGAATVTVPAAVTPGTVAIDSRTGKVIMLSVPTADGVTVRLDQSADFVLVDRSMDFSDTTGHWAGDSIAFVSAHGLFAGTGGAAFEPETPMTRAMLMTVLARFDGGDTEGGSVWYEKGMAWAVANGVSDGSDPGGSITREQLATMLWRYAGSPASSYALDQPDAGSTSDYAQTAMAWAVEVGILNGYDDGNLWPGTTATRAVVAAMIQRFCAALM